MAATPIGAVTVSASDTSSIQATVAAVAATVAISTSSSGTGVAIGASLAHNRISDGTDLGDGSVNAYIATSDVTAGQISVTAQSQQAISALVAAGSVAISGGDSTGLAVSGAGAVALNEINLSVNASIDGAQHDLAGAPNSSYSTNPATSVITASGVTVSAADTSSIQATVLAGSVAGAFGGESGYSIAIGVSFARNAITNPVTAQIADVKSLTTVTGAVQVAATENASISATTAAAAVSVAVGGGPNGVAVGGGGAIALNVIGVDTTADITGSQLVEVGDVIVTAIDSSSINAQVLAVAASVAVGDTAGVGVALGVSVADNQIDGVSGSQGALTADIADSGVDSSGDVEVDAYSTQTIIADTLAGAVAIGGGGETGVAVAGAGVYVANLISLAITADIDGGNSADITAASVSVNAYDASEIDSIDGAAAVSASFGGEAGVSVSIGLSIAQNTIDDPVSAYIQNVASLNATSVSTSEDRTLNPGDIVQLPNGVAYEYVGTTAETFNLDAAGTFSSSSWTQVGFVTTGPNGGGTQQLASLAPGDTVTIGAGFNTPTYTASDGVETLTPGELVSDAKGVVYAYKGASGTQSVDLSNADFTDATTWTRVASPGDVYTYIGPTNANADINSQAYYNTALWVAAAGATGKASFNTALPKNASSNSATLADGDTVELVANFSVQTGKYKVSQFEVGQSETLATGDTVQAANGDVYKYTGNGLTEDLTTEGFNSSYWTELNVVTLATGDTVEATERECLRL